MSRCYFMIIVCLIAGCSFRSGLEVQVQVYSGDDLRAIEYVPDLRGALIVTGKILAQSKHITSELERATTEGQEILDAMTKVIEGSAQLFANLYDEPDYQRAANAILTQAKTAAADINDLLTPALLNNPTALAGELLQLRESNAESWRGSAFDEALEVDGVNMVGRPTASIQAEITDPKEKESVGILISLLRETDTQRLKELSDDLANALEDSFTELSQLSADESTWTQTAEQVSAEEDELLSHYLDRFSALSQNIEDQIEPRITQLNESAASFEDAVREALEGKCGSLESSSSVPAECPDALSELGALIESAESFLSGVNGLDPDPEALFGEAVSEINESLAKAHVDYLRLEGRNQIDLPRGDYTISGEAARLATLSNAISETVSIAAATRQDVENLVAEIRVRPFVAADPNIKIVAQQGKDELWDNVVDGIVLSGMGESQYVVVQDAPTSYRPKELHVDPEGVIGLQLSMAEAGLDILTKVAAMSAGQPWLAGAGGSNDKEATVQIASVQLNREISDLIQDELERLKRQVGTLQTLVASSSDDDTADHKHIAVFRGLLQRAKARLGGIKTAEAESNGDDGGNQAGTNGVGDDPGGTDSEQQEEDSDG